MKKKKKSLSGHIETDYLEIYLTIDHLKNGAYTFHVVLNQKVIKTFTIEKK